MSTKFELNFQDLFEIDVTPDGAARTWTRLGKGIAGFTPSTNENIDQSTYLDGDGYGSSDVIGAQLTFAATGHRVVGDTAQDYIAGLEFELGEDRKTNFRAYNSIGEMKSGACTLANLVIGGGDAGAKKEIAFEVHINGKPTKTAAAAAAALTATVAAGSATGTTKFTATAGAGDTLAYRLTNAALTANANEYPGIMTGYTSGADIAATAGQYLNMYELNAYGRIVKFVSELLEAGDIKSA